MANFTTFVFTPAGSNDATLAIAASRAGAVGIYNAELDSGGHAAIAALGRLLDQARAAFGLKLDAIEPALAAAVDAAAAAGHAPPWLIFDAPLLASHASSIAGWRRAGSKVLAEVRCAVPLPAGLEAQVDGLVVKGNEAPGLVGEDASFILLQKWLRRTALPLVLRGGLTPQVAAAIHAVGAVGGVLESQLLLLDEARLPATLRQTIANLAGSETVAVGDGEAGEYLRILVRPPLHAARRFVGEGEGLRSDGLRERAVGHIDWQRPADSLLPMGQEVAFAAPWRRRYGSMRGIVAAIDEAVVSQSALARANPVLHEGGPLAAALGLRYPVVQGPMTRVSDTAEFALAVAEGGALPMVAFAMLKGRPLETLLEKTRAMLADRPWGIGLLGFAPQALLDEQLAIATKFGPRYAIIAGGRPDQAVHLEGAGVPTYLHVPSANLISGFLHEGARRFIFEGRECGGHIGPLSSFVLWSSMVDKLCAELAAGKVEATEIELLFAGGVHDALSSAMLQVLVAPLAALGARIGVLMGSAYLFTTEIVASGAIVEPFQREVLACDHTVNLESGPGHASRCAYTPFAADFFRQRAQLKRDGVPGDESRRVLDDLILGRLRVASKGSKRDGLNAPLQQLGDAQQRAEGMYMLGQVATLRDALTDIETLHREVTEGAAALLREGVGEAAPVAPLPRDNPADIAIIGVACVVPQASDASRFWENIVAKVDAITEIPSHRWDWRLYFDPDRKAKDKIYSKWGGFLDDLPFDPTQYGMPPKSIQSVDPMQMMGLEVARRTLADAGYMDRPFDRERASVIVGASGGAGDYGLQYGLRSELPRFTGSLPADVAQRLPEWTEDSFAGILPNVVAGRIANRLNFGGINLAVDAACASSLAAVYQAVTELVAGRSDLVIAGGVDTVQGPFGYLCFSKTQALSPTGRCRTFDAGGDGIVISEGIAMVALKRLADAERDGDRIYAVIKGVGASSDGSAKGLTAPLPAGQLRAMRRAYAMAGFGPSTVGLFEAHGTGTVAGDTAELESTTRLIREEGARRRQAVIGSVKTNIGHTKATAGVAGLMKAALALQHRVLPPHRNVTSPNAVLADPAAPLYLLDEPAPWLAAEQPRRAACSAFGFGGTNFHVVLQEYEGEYRDWLRPPASQCWSHELLVFGETDRAALVARVQALCDKLDGVEAFHLRDLAASFAARWHRRAETLAVVARDPADLRAKLRAALAFLSGQAKALPPGIAHGTAAAPMGKIALLFPGQGSQYTGMAREAALHFAPVAQALARADRVLADAFGARFGAGTRLSQFILPRGAYDDATRELARQSLTATDVAQPALGAVEAGLHALLHDLGLRGDMTAGHSYGEFAALHVAGAIDFDTLMLLSAARGRFIVDAAAAAGAELGTMAAVNAPRKIVEDAIADLDDVIIANHNAPLQCIISGTHQAVRAAAAKLREAAVEVSEIPVAAAFHSSLVRPAQAGLGELIAVTDWSLPTIPVYSNTTARTHPADLDRLKRQMTDHLVRPVEFVAQIEAMHADGARVFVEIGPKAVLSRLTSRILTDQPHVAIAVDDGNGLSGLLAGVGQLLCAGIDLDVRSLFAGRECRIGDPADPAALRPAAPLSKYAWMLNGSGARRASDPVRQIGVTVEQAQTAHPAQTVQLTQTTQTAPVAQSPVAAAAVQHAMPRPAAARVPPAAPSISQATPQTWRKGRTMDERRTGPGTADASVLSEYFATMRQFLETQERVMAAFLGAEVASMPARPLLRPGRPAALPRLATVAPPAQPLQPMPAVVPTVPIVAATQVSAAAAQAVAAPAADQPGLAPAKPALAAAASGLSRDQLTDMLLAIVEEKTGYPRDMVGLDQNLEADLGIDSIKRVEVVGTLLQQLPQAHREALKESRGKLNTQGTLGGMLDLVTAVDAGGTVAVPFDSAGAGSRVDAQVDYPPRLVMQAFAEPATESVARRPIRGRMLVTRDALGVADALAAQLTAAGAEPVLLDADALADEAALRLRLQGDDVAGPLAGIVHLASLGLPGVVDDSSAAAWRDALWHGEKSLFVLLQAALGRLADGAHVVVASDLGGHFGRDGTASPELRLLGGSVGALKSLRDERPGLRVKAVDLAPALGAAAMAGSVLDEMSLDGGRQEVGYPGGQRTVFRSVAVDTALESTRQAGLADAVVLATGGARGITAEVLRELARPGSTLVLTGRSKLADAEDQATAGLLDADALRQYFVDAVRAGREKINPAEIRRRVQALLGAREMRANIADLRAAGAMVEYRAVDVTDEAAVAVLLADLRQRHGRVDGVVHGAGIIEDKLLAEKDAASWSRVVETKVLGLLALARHVDAGPLRFFTVFSSVAGRYGNSGQADYATANELMNRLCQSLQVRWGDGVAVSALCWGPWGATTRGAGMVTAETEAKFAARGVKLVTPALGRRLFAGEIARPPGLPVEVICGSAPWESREAEHGLLRQIQAPDLGPLVGCAVAMATPTGERDVAVHLDPASHLYLQEHALDDKLVLPAAAALELMAETAAALWPGWAVVEVREHKLLKGVELGAAGRTLRVHLSPPPYGSSEGFEVSASLQSELPAGGRIQHYRAVIRLEQALPQPWTFDAGRHDERALSVEQAYGQWLFHGPRLQVIERIEGLSKLGASARVRSTRPAHWLRQGQGAWLFDPALLDAAAQMAWLWARAYRDESALPTRFGRVVRYRATLPDSLRMVYQRVATDDPTLIRANVAFLDDAGDTVLLIEELDSIASAALNRLGGTARKAEETAQ